MSKWISVKDNLPDNGQLVLICGLGLPDGHEIALYKDGRWHIIASFTGKKIITHWMPLPEPPKD